MIFLQTRFSKNLIIAFIVFIYKKIDNENDYQN
ncbi:hypothetical protein CF65_00588 [Aggregatibacter actinomycetemcomitans HK1651]|nr:hypothetical protein CF65_00588 [Aggregatibacter actinomycetemcomitans HK1651]